MKIYPLKSKIFIRFFPDIIYFFLAFNVFCTLISCGNSAVENSADSYNFTSFRDIPGVTEAEINAIEALSENTGYFTYGMIMTNETFYINEDEIGGYTALLCGWLTELFGISFVPEIFTWNELRSKLISGEIDFTGELTATDERRKNYFMTDAIAERYVKYMRIEDSIPLNMIAMTRPLRYAFLEGSTTVNDVSADLMNETFEILLVSDTDAAYSMLNSGEADAFFGDGLEASFDIYPDVIAYDVFPVIHCPVSLTAYKQELAPIISVVQKALEEGANRYLTELYNIGEQDYLKHKLFLKLNGAEKEIINNSPVINIAAEYDNYPICFYDTYSKEWQGIAIDVIKEIELLTDLKFKIINGPNTEWSVLLNLLETGEASIISELMRTEDREGRFIWPHNEIFTDYPILVSSTDRRNIKINEVLFLKIGLVDPAGHAEFFRRWFPNHRNTISYPNMDAAFAALERGEIDLMVSSQSRLLMYTHFHEKAGYKANVIFDYPFKSTFGFYLDETDLCSIIDKAINIINTKDIADFWMNRTYDYRRMLAEARTPWLLGITIISIIAITLLFTLLQRNRLEGRQLESLINERTAELHNSQRELVKLFESAKAANNAKSIFLANMSHEIRTPMNSIMGFSELALDDKISDKTRDFINNIKMNAEWLLQIINDILDISKIESGKMELENIPFNLQELIKTCRMFIMPKAEEKGIALYFYAEPSVGKIPLGDPTRLRQVLVNLLSNAVKFTKFGMIKLNVSIIDKSDNGIKLHFEVKDSGIGMTENQIEKIFNPFMQAESGTTRKYGGTGLGLSITKNIVEMMGGKLTVDSIPGVGSKFSFDLVLQTIDDINNEKINNKIPVNNIEKPLFKGEVLLCEDNEMNQVVLCEHLSRVGLSAVVAENGQEGIDLINERINKGIKQFDLIFMDMHMPVMDGLDASAEIIKLNIGVPIIAMTANVMTDNLDIYRANGINDYVSKPFTSQELWHCLLKYFKPETKRE